MALLNAIGLACAIVRGTSLFDLRRWFFFKHGKIIRMSVSVKIDLLLMTIGFGETFRETAFEEVKKLNVAFEENPQLKGLRQRKYNKN